MDLETKKSYGDKIGRSLSWVSAAIRLGKVEATKVGNQYVISGKEVARFKKKPFVITKKEMFS